MDNYTYNPSNQELLYSQEPQDLQELQSLQENNNIGTDEPGYSTSLNELDTIELLNRNSDYYVGNQVITPDNNYPDILKRPLFMNTVRPGGILKKGNAGSTNKKVTFKPTKFNEMTLGQLSTDIANSLKDILNELINFNGNKEEFLDIFTKDNRLLAIGVLFVIISLFILFFINTNTIVTSGIKNVIIE